LRRRSKIIAAASAALLGTAGVVVAATLANAATTNVALKGSIPAWANSKNLQGTADPNEDVGFRVYLGWNNPSAVDALAAAVSDPNSSSYRQFLTPQQFRQQFAPSQQQVGAVQSWLKSQGFSVEYTPQNNHYVSAEGTVAQAAAAFGTTFGEYSVDGLTVRSPESDLTMPSTIAGAVTGVVGLDDSAQFVTTYHTTGDAPPPAAFVSASPCSSYWGQTPAVGFPNPIGSDALNYAPCGYTPAQIKGAYGLPTAANAGAGQTVAIIDAYAAPTILNDVNHWSDNRGLPEFQGSQFSQVVAPGTYHHPEAGKKQDPQGWYGEETLDVEAVHGMAPGANVVYVGAPNNFQDLDAALNDVVDKHLADIVTNSYGFDTELLHPGFIKPQEDTIEQGVIEGIGIYFSSGDNGDESDTVGYRTADWPASSPWVTAVGGTSLGVDASNTRLFETGWGTHTESWNANTSTWGPDFWLYGGGGGVSMLFPEPFYQLSANLSSVFSVQGRSGRAVPDIAAVGDPNTGYLIGETQTFPDGSVNYSEYRIGGTSLSSPLIAGIMALANQAAGGPLGFINPRLYSHAGALYDVTGAITETAMVRTNYNNGIDASGGLSYRLRTLNQTQSLATGPGYDDVTGLGTPNAGMLAALS
jgi:subtilase family serine protease